MTAKLADKRFLIIAGQPKAGTTSLFDWLAQHPDICASSVKETRFFLDNDYPLPRGTGYDGTNLADYAHYFDRPERQVLMEATPDYLYCETPLKIAEALPNARLVVIERDPVDRVRSAYRFFRQRGMLPGRMSLDDYVARQMAQKLDASIPVPFRILDQSRPEHRKRFEHSFGDRLLLARFEELKNDPEELLARICAHVGIAPMRQARREAANVSGEARSQTVARLYYALDGQLRGRFYENQFIRPFLGPIARLARRLLIASNKRPADPKISPESAAAVRAVAEGLDTPRVVHGDSVAGET